MFGGTREILGRTLRLNGKPYQVIGVMPANFGFPHKTDLAHGNGHIETTDIWLPSALTPEQSADREDFGGVAIERLKSGMTLQAAGTEMRTIMSRLDSAHSEDMRGWSALVKPFVDTALGPVRPLMGLLLGAVCFVLLIACANAASLFLARAADRAHELGVRATLAWIIHDFTGERRRDALKGVMNTGFSRTRHSLSEHPRNDILLYTTADLSFYR
jgi:hypothetical protein